MSRCGQPSRYATYHRRVGPTLRLLGSVAVVQDGVEERLSLERPISLLAYLAVRGGWVDRVELAFLYRPDVPEAQALTYLRKVIFRARTYPWAAGFEVDGDALRWLVPTDVARFGAAAAASDWAAALAAYGGPFLGGASLSGAPGFAEWQEVERAALEATWLRAAEQRADEFERAGTLDEALALHRAVLDRDPFAESTVQALLRLLDTSGRRQEALAVYESFRRDLRDELGAEPLETTEVLADNLRRSRDGTSRVVERAARSHLPSPGTPFVGRRDELITLAGLLGRSDVRLVTIVGLGGSGKTRLALEAVRREEARGAAVHFVSLAAASVEDAAAHVVEALGLAWDGLDAEHALLAGLRERDALLLLDNFETVIEAASLVAGLLEASPRLRVLVTSREPLNVYGEWLVDLGGLAAPPDDEGVDARAFDAVELFIQQAARTAPSFAPGRAGVAAIAELCRRLEGLPLAIELTASWSRLLSPAELLEQLDHEPGLLVSQRRDVAPRHQSLWRVFDHAWERSRAREREALPRLAVFAGGFDIEAAEAVAGARLDTLLRLMDLKLVRRSGEGRFALHQLVKQYALQRGAEAELAAARREHSRYFCSLLGRLGDDLKGRDVAGGLSAVQADLTNFVSAWDDAVTRMDVAALDEARDALDHYFYYRARFPTAVDVFSRAAAAVGAAAAAGVATDVAGGRVDSRRLEARLLLHQAEHERHLTRVRRSHDLALRALAILEEVAGPVDVAHAQLVLGLAAERLGEYADAQTRLRAVLIVAEQVGDLYLQGAAHNSLANLTMYTEGDIEVAEGHYRASLDANRRLGNVEGINGALINLGACRYDVHDFDGAERYWDEAAALAKQHGYKQREAVLHNNLGSLHEARGERVEAREHYERSLAVRRDIGDVSGEANVLHNLGRLASALGDLKEARGRLSASLRLYLKVEDKAGVTHVRSSLARVLAASGRDANARAEASLALETALDIGSRRDILGSLLTVAILQERAGRASDAAALAGTVAVAAAGNSEPLRVEAEALVARLGADSREHEGVEGAELAAVARRELARLSAEAWNGGGTATS